MAIEFLSIVIFTFSLALFALGAVTWWIERPGKRVLGLAMVGSALVIAFAYAFLGSRFALALFGRLIIRVDLPRLMVTAVLYTLGVLAGFGLAGGLFLWISGSLVRPPTRVERRIGAFVLVVLAVALAISIVAVQLGG